MTLQVPSLDFVVLFLVSLFADQPHLSHLHGFLLLVLGLLHFSLTTVSVGRNPAQIQSCGIILFVFIVVPWLYWEDQDHHLDH